MSDTTPAEPAQPAPTIVAEQAPSKSSNQQEQSTLAEPSFKVYKPSDSASSAAPLPPLSDDFFTPTGTELKFAQAQLSARNTALNDAPLQLRSTREAAEKQKRDRWPQTKIRIRFTDRTQLEKVFPSTSKIKPVYAFVRELLQEDIKPIKFILYQPPKQDLKVSDPTVRDKTLAELGLAPSSILLLRFEDDKLNRSDFPAPLLPSVLANAIDLPVPPPIPGTEKNAKAQSSQASSSKGGDTVRSQVENFGAEAEKKLSKFFKGLTKK